MRQSVDMQRGFPYRRRLFAARHRRRSLWVRLARPLFGALLLVGSPAALTAWVLTSPEFTVREIVVTGSDRVEEGWVRETLAGVAGSSVFDIETGEIERRLLAHPWLAAVGVRKRLPDRLEVDLVERYPAALFRRDGDLLLVDADGEIFTSFDPEAGGESLLLLSGADDRELLRRAMRAARELERIEPEWGASLSEIEVLNESDLRLHTSALPFPIVVRTERMAEAIKTLRDHLPQMREHLDGVGAIDMRFQRYIVVQPVKEG
ncbi:MAG: FtsQ-type POTRA domain-containing protein [Acidobacteriota bacterium]